MQCFSYFPVEYTITMYDTKNRELRWNATYSDYASTLPDDDTKYSKTLRPCSFVLLFTNGANDFPALRFFLKQRWLILSPTAMAWW